MDMTTNTATITRKDRKAIANLHGAERQLFNTQELLALAIRLGDEQHADMLRRDEQEWENEVEACREDCVRLGLTPEDCE